MKLLSAIIVALACVIGSGTASADPGKMSMDGLAPTGETESCLRTYQIRETKVIDNATILFRMYGDDYYVNRLPTRCSGLKIQGGFSYTIRGLNQLCNTDSIRVISSVGGNFGAVCPLGDFEKLKPKEE